MCADAAFEEEVQKGEAAVVREEGAKAWEAEGAHAAKKVEGLMQLMVVNVSASYW